jgi:hypothetical protein
MPVEKEKDFARGGEMEIREDRRTASQIGVLSATLIGFLVGATVMTVLPTLHAQHKAKWTKVECWTNDCIADALNRLSPEVAAEAKLTTWKSTTYVWYSE